MLSRQIEKLKAVLLADHGHKECVGEYRSKISGAAPK